MSVAPQESRSKPNYDYDGTYVIEFRTANGEVAPDPACQPPKSVS